MSIISIRLPEELEARLEREAQLVGKKRSELAREAISRYLQRQERARLVADMVQEAKALYANSAPGEDAGEGIEEWLAAIEDEERDAGVDPDERWWDAPG